MVLMLSDPEVRRHVGEPGFTTTTTNPPPCSYCRGQTWGRDVGGNLVECGYCEETGRAQPGVRVYFNAPALLGFDPFTLAKTKRVKTAGLLGYGTLDETWESRSLGQTGDKRFWLVRFVDCVWFDTPLTYWPEPGSPYRWGNRPASSLPDGWSVPPVGLLETLEATNG